MATTEKIIDGAVELVKKNPFLPLVIVGLFLCLVAALEGWPTASESLKNEPIWRYGLLAIGLVVTGFSMLRLTRQFTSNLAESTVSSSASLVKTNGALSRGGFAIEGRYVAPSEAVNVITHLSGKVYVVQGRTWEGVGFVDGNFYYGIYKYSDNPDVKVAGNWGAHRAEIRFDELRVFVIELRDKFESIGKLSIWKKASS